MTVADTVKYQRYRETRTEVSGPRRTLHELWLPVLLFGSMGAVTWAIRGTDGWGGIDGTIVPGMTWGLFWYYLCCRKGIDARGIPLWLGLGIAVGGELGYGQYISWIQGRFNVGDQVIPVAAWMGYAWLVVAGIGWGAPGGIALGWALGERAAPGRWLVRLTIPLGVACLGWFLVQRCPGWFFPNYALNLYAGQLDRHLARTVYTNTQDFTVVAWWLGAMLVAAFQRDRATLAVGALIGGGFGPGFSLAALWCLGYTYAPGYIDWWKMWELNAGFNLGLLYVLALYWATRQFDKRYSPNGVPLGAAGTPPHVSNRSKDLSLTAAVFFLLYILFRGASYRAGVLLGLYDATAVDQYVWPAARTALFAPFAVLSAGVALASVGRILWPSRAPIRWRFNPAHLPQRMAALMIAIGAVGIVTIWPSLIGLFYILFLSLAIFAFYRLGRWFRAMDASVGQGERGPAKTAR